MTLVDRHFTFPSQPSFDLSSGRFDSGRRQDTESSTCLFFFCWPSCTSDATALLNERRCNNWPLLIKPVDHVHEDSFSECIE